MSEMIIELGETKESTWNATLSRAQPKGTIFQSTFWAGYLKRTLGDRPIYIASVDKKGEIQGMLLAMESCYGKHAALTMLGFRGFLFGRMYKHLLSPPLHRTLPFIYWENGPVIVTVSEEDSDRKTHYYEILKGILQKAHERNCYEIKFARPMFFQDNSETFSSLGFEKKRMGTILDSLDTSVEVLWQRLERKHRRIVERAMERGVEIRRASNLRELRDFYAMITETNIRAKTKIYPFSFFASLWEYFSPLDKIAVFTAYIRNSPVGTALFLMHNEIIHLYTLGDSDYARSNKIYPNDLLIWHVMQWAHEKGFRYFDHSGVELYKIDVGNEKAQGIYRYKSKWGGQTVEYHDYSKSLHGRKILGLMNRFLVDPVLHN